MGNYSLLMLIVLCYITIISCKHTIKETDLYHLWEITNIVQDDKSIIDRYNYNKCVTFRNPQGNIIYLPSKDDIFDIATWKFVEEKSNSYIEISETTHGEFDGTYLIFLDKYKGILQLSSDHKSFQFRKNEFSLSNDSINCGLQSKLLTN